MVIFMLACGWLRAQPSVASLLHYTTNEGLSNDNITAIAKDQQGFLWIGTVNGLNRFDGIQFKTFHHEPKDKNSLLGNYVLGITLAPNGHLWVSTDQGLNILDPAKLEFQAITFPEQADSLQNDGVSPVVFDAMGMAWTTTHTAIRQIDPKKKELRYSFNTEKNAIGWFGIAIDDRGHIWFANNGIHRFDPATGTLKYFVGANPREGFEAANPLSVQVDAKGEVYAGTWHKGIWKYHEGLDEFVRFPMPHGFSPTFLPDLTEGGAPAFWIGGGETGLAWYNLKTKEFQEFRRDVRDPFTHNNYQGRCFFKDKTNGDVWIGTEIGLEHYAPNSIRFGRSLIPPVKEVGVFSLVSGIVKDRTDPTGQRYFVGVWGTGLYTWNKATGEAVRMKSSNSDFSSNAIFNIFQDSKGYVWGCLGYNFGIGRYNPRTGEWKDYRGFFKNKDRPHVVWCGMEDSAGNVWFGTSEEGLYRYNPLTDQIEQAFFDKKMVNDKGRITVYSMSEDQQGRLWLGCVDVGVVRFDPKAKVAHRFQYKVANPHEGCKSIVAAPNGRVYAGFTDALLELDQSTGKELRRFTNENGLKTTRIIFSAVDKLGRIWFTSEYLLHCFDPKTGEFSYYGSEDGLFSNAMTDAFCKVSDGEFFVGFQNAFNHFYPERLRLNTVPPPVTITSMKVMDKERKASILKTLTLDLGFLSSSLEKVEFDTFLSINPGEDIFTIEFAALNFNQPQRNRYAYMLEGFNKDWIYTDRPIATFTNMDGGNYTFRVKACNNDGIWNESGTAIEVRIKPPFIKSWGFKLLAASVLGLLVFGFFKYREFQRQRLDKFREGLARDLHDEMGSTLSSIRFFSEFAKQQIGEDKPTVTPVLQRISDSASALGESMQDIIWAMKTKNDHLEDLAARMTEFGLRLLESRNIRFTSHVNEAFLGKQLKPEQRRNIYLIFKEAINNAAKYAEATEVELFLALKNGHLLMRISDNGKGFEPGELATGGGGNGLNNMQHRAAAIGGKVELSSTPGQGTKVELRVKV